MEIKPCPFCGGEAQVHSVLFQGPTEEVTCYRIVHTCDDKKVSISVPIGGRLFESKEEAIRAWNKRYKEASNGD